MDLLEQKRLEIIDINKQSFSPQKLMADRDVGEVKTNFPRANNQTNESRNV